MYKHLLLLLSLYFFVASLSAQTDRADYGAAQEEIVGVSITSTGTVYSFLGGINVGDGNYFPDTLSLVGANNLDRQEGSPLGENTTLDTWWSPTDNSYYQLEIVNFNCDAGAEGMQISSFPKDNPAQVSTVDISDLVDGFLPNASLAVTGNRFAIYDQRQVIISRFDALLDSTIVRLRTFPDVNFSSRMTTTGENIHIADGTRLITVDNNDNVSEVSISNSILGLGVHGFSNPDVLAVTAIGSYRFINGAIFDSTLFTEDYTFESLVMNPHGRGFLCTYQEDRGVLRYGQNTGFSTIASFTTVDPNNSGKFTEYVQTSTSAGGNARSVAVLYFKESNSSILMSTQNAIEFVDLELADVEIIDVEMEVEIIDPTTTFYFAKPTIRNNSADTIGTLQVVGNFFIATCLARDAKVYTGLSILPGEEKQLERIEISSPALETIAGSVFGRINLTSANNFPIKPGNLRSVIGEVIISDLSDAYAKTLAVWPNPVSDVLHVDASTLSGIRSVLVSDVLGKTHALPFENGQVNVAQLPKGHYALVLVDDRGDAARSVFVKQ